MRLLSYIKPIPVPRRMKYALGWLLLLPVFLFAQTKTISGTVKDEAGKPLQAVSVSVKNKPGGTQTDASGNFTLSASTGSTLVFSSVGFENYEVTVGSNSTYDISLKPSSEALNDVVVVGYGTQKRVSVTGAVSVVDKKLIENRPVTNAIDALQGTAPGLVVTRTSGQPGKQGWNLNIRGLSSLNGTNNPLVIIDGVEGDLIQINPTDIESVSVLKDAAAAAIFGAKSSGGVVIITTKKGSGGFRVTYSSLLTDKKPYGIPQRVPTWLDAQMRNIANANAGGGPTFSEQQIGWLKSGDSNFIYRNANPSLNGFYYNADQTAGVLRKSSPSQYNNIAVSGGNSQTTQYMFSLGYYKENGVFAMGPDAASRLNARLNLTTRFNKYLSLDSRISYTQAKIQSPSAGVNGDYGLLYNIYQIRTFNPVTFPGDPSKYISATANSLQNGGYNNMNNPQLDGIFTVKAENLVKGLTVRAVYSPRMQQFNNDIFFKTYPNWGFDTMGRATISGYSNNPNSITKTRATQIGQDFQALADYDLTVAENHHFHTLGGFQYQYYNYDFSSAQARALVTNTLPSLNFGSNPNVVPVVSDNIQNNTWVSYFGRLSYDFNEKFFVEATVRNDASSKLAPGHRSQIFPAFSAAWRVSKEDWFNRLLPFVNEFKLRGSWGKLGNAQLGTSNQNNYNYITQLSNGGVYPFNGVSNPSLYQGALPSEGLGWETVKTTDIGLDIGVLKNRLTASFDYFVRNNDNVLIQLPLPAVLGVGANTTNAAAIKTWGWEATIGWRDRAGSFNYWASFNIGDNQNKITRYDGNITIVPGVNAPITGLPANSIFGYRDEGYFSSAEEVAKHAFQDNRTGPGDIKYKDIDGDGKINNGNNTLDNHGDLVYLGNTAPRFNFGFNLGAQWKGFDIAAFFQGTGKRNINIYSYSIIPFANTWRSAWDINTDYWTPENQDARFPRLYTNGTQNIVESSHWVQNAAYIRLKNLQVGYTLPSELTKKIKIQTARIFFSGQDLWEKNKMWYKYYDAENPTQVSFNYPFFRSYAVGLNVTF